MTALVDLWRPSPGDVLGGVVVARVTDRAGVVMIDVQRKDGSVLRWRTGYPSAAESLAALEESGELTPGEPVAIEHRREGQTVWRSPQAHRSAKQPVETHAGGCTDESAADPMTSVVPRASEIVLTGVVAGRNADGFVQLLIPIRAEGMDDIEPGTTITIHGKTHFGHGGATVRGRLLRAWQTPQPGTEF